MPLATDYYDRLRKVLEELKEKGDENLCEADIKVLSCLADERYGIALGHAIDEWERAHSAALAPQIIELFKDYLPNQSLRAAEQVRRIQELAAEYLAALTEAWIGQGNVSPEQTQIDYRAAQEYLESLNPHRRETDAAVQAVESIDSVSCGHCGESLRKAEAVSSCSGDSHERCRQSCATC